MKRRVAGTDSDHGAHPRADVDVAVDQRGRLAVADGDPGPAKADRLAGIDIDGEVLKPDLAGAAGNADDVT